MAIEQAGADSAATPSATSTQTISTSAKQESQAPEAKGFDMKAAVDTVSESIFGKKEANFEENEDFENTQTSTENSHTEAKTTTPTQEKTPEIAKKTPPQSWKKDMHENWGKLDQSTQEYIELREKQMVDGLEKDRSDANLGRVMRDTMSPYKAMLQAQGVDEPRAVQALLNAHYKLTNGDPATKAGFFKQLARDYGIDLGQIQSSANGTQTDPVLQALQTELHGIKQTISSSQEKSLQESKARVLKDVEAFASDPAHLYFDEVANEITSFIQSGSDLKDAYEKAVWANPITRQKEMSRMQTEQETKIREQAKLEAETAKKAASVNVKNRDTRRTPTEPKGSMEDTMQETLRTIKTRT